MSSFTTVVAVDSAHYSELLLSWKTWRKFRSEIWDNPLLVISDGTFDLSGLGHNDVTVVPPMDGEFPTQREKMLNSLAFLPAYHCHTEWFLKLDTDTVAMWKQAWLPQEWLESKNVFVASKWGYTKPASMQDELDAWACRERIGGRQPDRRPGMSNGVPVAKCNRVTSYVMLCRTRFARDVAVRCLGRLPVPSQDTVYWYLADRLGLPYLRVSMEKFGWRHGGSSIERVRELCLRSQVR